VKGGPARRIVTLLAIAAGCRGSLSPLSNRLKVGQEPYVVFVADGEDGVGDLFAASTGGGAAFQVTFTRVNEQLPALSPDGTMLAFIRSDAPGNAEGASLVVMNLLNGAERRTPLAGPAPERLAWSQDGTRIYLRAGDSLQVTAAPPARLALGPVSAAERPTADSLFRVLLGDPPRAEAVPCESGGICARFADGRTAPITSTGSLPVRWPGDSLLYREGDSWVVRPLAGGKTRGLAWTSSLVRPRELTVFGGPPQSAD